MRLRLVVADIDIRIDCDQLDDALAAALQLLDAAKDIDRETVADEVERPALGFAMTTELDADRHARNLGEPDWDEESP
jgi:hypothetical protein